MSSHRFFRIPFLIAALTSMMLVVAVACGSSSDSETTQATNGGTSDTSVPVATSAPDTSVPASTKPEGKLTIALTDLGNETPSVWQEFAFGKSYMRFIFDSLTGTNDEGEVDKTTGAAIDWSMSSDAINWTFTLRDDIEFHNGDPLTAEDVKFSIALMTSEDSVASYKTKVTASIPSPDAITVVSQPNWLSKPSNPPGS